MDRNSESVSDVYRKSNIMTAGRVKSVELLLEKAFHLLEPVEFETLEDHSDNIRQVRNILTQLQMSLNLKNSEAAVHIFEVYELAQNALASPSGKSLEVARLLIGDLIQTLRMAFGR